ncbi:MAG: hypothetical protein K2W95_04230 [Candidatus Obscuribacterales bacterium]|nr:hypothetical protein [Candidatus Obscuribacterales bacterium]
MQLLREIDLILSARINVCLWVITVSDSLVVENRKVPESNAVKAFVKIAQALRKIWWVLF